MRSEFAAGAVDVAAAFGAGAPLAEGVAVVHDGGVEDVGSDGVGEDGGVERDDARVCGRVVGEGRDEG